MALWLGGFSFYGAWVVGILHEVLDSLTTGTITREVTAVLNAIGLATLALWWAHLFLQRGRPTRRGVALRMLLWFTCALILALLALMHHEMAARLDAGRLRGFYGWHRAYLILSTVQWVAGVALFMAEFVPSRPHASAAQSGSPR
jgi:hypothetical protein